MKREHDRFEELRQALLERLVVSVADAAKLLGIDRNTAYKAAKDGSLPTIRVANRLLVPTAALRFMLGVEPGTFPSVSTSRPLTDTRRSRYEVGPIEIATGPSEGPSR